MSHWCEVHEVNHEGEWTVVYTIEVMQDRKPWHSKVKNITMRVCNDVAVTLGLTQRDPLVVA